MPNVVSLIVKFGNFRCKVPLSALRDAHLSLLRLTIGEIYESQKAIGVDDDVLKLDV